NSVAGTLRTGWRRCWQIGALGAQSSPPPQLGPHNLARTTWPMQFGLRALEAPRWFPILARPLAQILAISASGSSPAQLLHGPAGVPDLCHVLDLVAVEFHDVDVIGTLESPARRRSGTAFARVGTGEDPIGANVLALPIDGKRAHFVCAIGKNGQQSLHPIRILLKRLDTHERFSLRRKCSIGSAKCFATTPTLTSFARDKELLRYVSHRCHRGYSSGPPVLEA